MGCSRGLPRGAPGRPSPGTPENLPSTAPRLAAHPRLPCPFDQAPKTDAPAGAAEPKVVTTELIQKYLDENQQLILAILENQNVGSRVRPVSGASSAEPHVPRRHRGRGARPGETAVMGWRSVGCDGGGRARGDPSARRTSGRLVFVETEVRRFENTATRGLPRRRATSISESLAPLRLPGTSPRRRRASPAQPRARSVTRRTHTPSRPLRRAQTPTGRLSRSPAPPPRVVPAPPRIPGRFISRRPRLVRPATRASRATHDASLPPWSET